MGADCSSPQTTRVADGRLIRGVSVCLCVGGCVGEGVCPERERERERDLLFGRLCEGEGRVGEKEVHVCAM